MVNAVTGFSKKQAVNSSTQFVAVNLLLHTIILTTEQSEVLCANNLNIMLCLNTLLRFA